MKWSYWIELYIRTHCVARGLRPLTLAAYEDALKQFREWVRVLRTDIAPDQVAARDVLAYLQYLRDVRGNGGSAVNRAVVVLRRFYCAMVAMGYLDHTANPLIGFPSIKAVPRKLPVSLSSEQVSRLLAEPEVDTDPLNFTDPTGLDSYLACQTENHSGCGQVDNGSEQIWVQGQTVDGKFQAYDIDMNRDGSGLYSDQFGHDYTGTFDQNGLSFNSVDEGGPSGSGRFINGSDETDVNGSGIFSGLQGKFVSDCGGSCQARGSLYELEPGSGAMGRAEAALQLQGKSWSWLDRLSGAHAEGRQWMDANGRIHVIENINGINAGKTELHFEGHPNTGVTERSLHLVNAIRDLASGRAEEQKNLKLP